MSVTKNVMLTNVHVEYTVSFYNCQIMSADPPAIMVVNFRHEKYLQLWINA